VLDCVAVTVVELPCAPAPPAVAVALVAALDCVPVPLIATSCDGPSVAVMALELGPAAPGCDEAAAPACAMSTSGSASRAARFSSDTSGAGSVLMCGKVMVRVRWEESWRWELREVR
jgi:hypothetical protein